MIAFRRFVNFFSFRSYWVVVLPLGLALAAGLVIDGFQWYDALILAAYAGGAAWLNRRLRLAPAKTAEPGSVASRLGQGRPVLLEFHSDACAACMVMQSVVDDLESETGAGLEVLRVNVGHAPGRALAERYRVNFSPTFILFDGQGRMLDEMVFVLNRARVLYWLGR